IIETSLWQIKGHSYGAGDPVLGVGRYLADLTMLANSPRYRHIPVVYHTDHIKGPETMTILRAAIQGVEFNTHDSNAKLYASTVSLDASDMSEDDNIANMLQLCRFAEEAGVEVTLEMESAVDDRITPAEETEKLIGSVEAVFPNKIALWAPGVGTQHGFTSNDGYAGFQPKTIEDNVRLLQKITGRSIGIALHGSTGLDADKLRTASQCGVTKVNWSSESLYIRSMVAQRFYTDFAEKFERSHKGWKNTVMDNGLSSYVAQAYIPRVAERMILLGGQGQASKFFAKTFYGLFLCLLSVMPTFSQQNLLESLLRSKPEQFGEVLKEGNPYEVQIIYTQINRDKKNRPRFTSYQFGVDKNRYFYPASTVKLPAVLLALEKINYFRKSPNLASFNKYSTMLTDSAFERQTSVRADTSAPNGLPSVAHYAKKILLVSDNDAYNRLYEFVGQGPFNELLHSKGYRDTRILHRLSYAMTSEQNRHTNPIRFLENNQFIFKQLPAYNPDNYVPAIPIKKGIGYMDSNDKLVKEPFDFTTKNAFPLHDQQALLRAILFPESVKKSQRFYLTEDDYRFVYQYMSQLPSETTYPRYNPKEIWDSYCKFTLFGTDKSPLPKHIRIFNKVGDAYGFLLDNAYVVDFNEGIEFMVSAVIYCNSDGIFNDDKYDYDRVGFPFFANLGKLLYDYERTRPKAKKPDLSKFQLRYDKP
nr:class II fructose-bisphosphate aldolase [Spirosomataceae bacterium]